MARRSKVSSPFGITVTLDFIDPALMEDLRYYISVRGRIPTPGLSNDADITDQQKNRFMSLDL